ncbi:hypothetical protein CDL12_05131 [Handroanthus impetiginosus]|uniref:Uncharacterized protein n=1 Tax=Handroanthus impetiginosus TaxID=429701 RepID=A0A2G9HX96_9LAMI|nr:hypothetical protein CDL12_05131 [Handroanthus impetiginosus]
MKEKKMIQELSELQASSTDVRESRNFRNWFSFIDAVMLSRNKALLPVKKLRNSLIANSNLHRTLYGFIVFEVSWSDVRGINYFNELQTDTSLAIEAKIMRRFEFDSIAHAAKSISSWFPGTLKEQTLLKEHLEATISEDFYDALESFPRTTEADINNIIIDDIFAGKDSLCPPSHTYSVYPETTGYIKNRVHTPPPRDGPYKRRKVMRSIDTELEKVLRQTSDPRDSEETIEPTLYRDVLILFRFNDRDLPFKLKDIIMSQLWLLTLLEAGLPSWVIFLQSYPGFCRLYRPWMCPLARVLYVLISVITVLIGFYDMYKNVPLLKVTASHLFGPFFYWIEEWEMISRIKYLGTMLFIHNFQKAIKWFLTVIRIIFSIVSFFIQPIAQPFTEFLDCFLPLWSIFIKVADNSFSLIRMVVEFSVTLIGDFVEILLLPLWYVLAVAWNVALGFCSIVAFLCTFIYQLVGDLWLTARGIFQFTRGVESTVSSYEVSVWRSLWNDLFSQVEFIQRLLRTMRAWSKENSRTGQTSEVQLTVSQHTEHHHIFLEI